MPSKESRLVKETEHTQTWEKPVYTGTGKERKNIGTIVVELLKATAPKAAIMAFLNTLDAPFLVASYNYGADLVKRRPFAGERPGVVVTTVKLHGVDHDMRTMKAVDFAKLVNVTKLGVEIGKVKAVPAGMALVAQERKAEFTEKDGLLSPKAK